jgi:hypothetical protein
LLSSFFAFEAAGFLVPVDGFLAEAAFFDVVLFEAVLLAAVLVVDLAVVFLAVVFFAGDLEAAFFLEMRLGTTLSRTSPTLS